MSTPPETAPLTPSTSPTITPRQRLDTLLIQVNTSQNLSEDLKKNLSKRIEGLQAEERQSQLDQTKLEQLEREIQDIEGGLRIELPSPEDPMSDFSSAFEGTGLLSGTQGQQAEQVMQSMGKLKKMLYGLATFLGGFPLIGPMVKDWIKTTLPEPVQQEMERDDLGRKIVKKMKKVLGSATVAPPPSEDLIPRYIERLQQIYNQAPQPKPASFEVFCDQKIDRLSSQYRGRSQYTLDDLVRLALIETAPQNAKLQEQQAKETKEKLKALQTKEYAFSLVKTFNTAEGKEIVPTTPTENEHPADYARRICTELADALKNKQYQNCKLCIENGWLVATDTSRASWAQKFGTAFCGCYYFPDSENFMYNLKNDPKSAFEYLVKIDSTLLDDSSMRAIDNIKTSLIKMQADFTENFNASTPPATNTPRPVPMATASPDPAADSTTATV